MSDEKLIVTKNKLDALATSISNKSGVATPLTIAQMKAAVDGISGGTITQDEDGYIVLGQNGGGSLLYEEITVETDGEVTQAVEDKTIYHFTGNLTSLTVTTATPTEGRYEFDFVSGETAPTVIIPDTWVVPNGFIIEPKARYRIIVENGYMSMQKWADNHSPFTYIDIASGDFTVNTNSVSIGSNGNIFANIGSEIIAISCNRVVLKSQLSTGASIKICDISASAKALMGQTYVSSVLYVYGKGLVTSAVFNTWEDKSEITIQNSTGVALAANTELNGTIYILRTL